LPKCTDAGASQERTFHTFTLLLEDGRVAEQGALSELLAAPLSLTLQAFARHLRV